MDRPKYIIRHMRAEDFEQVLDICTEVGFAIAIHDLSISYPLDPDGFFVAQNLDSGEVIGSCTGVKLTESLAFIGTYVVKPNYQNMGIGFKIWDKVIEHIGNECNISLVTAESMFEKYREQFGSVLVDSRCLARFYSEHNKLRHDLLIGHLDGVSVIQVDCKNFKSVVQYDANVCGIQRELLISEAIKQSDNVVLAAVNSNDKKVVGYCIFSITNTDCLLAQPLYANNTEIAELLLSKGYQKMSQSHSHSQTNGLIVFSWDSNEKMKSICNKIGLNIIRKAQIIFTKEIVTCDFDKIFGVSSLYFFPF